MTKDWKPKMGMLVDIISGLQKGELGVILSVSDHIKVLTLAGSRYFEKWELEPHD